MAMWQAWKARKGLLKEQCPFYAEGTWGIVREDQAVPSRRCVNEVTGEVFGQRCCSTHRNMLIFRAARAGLGDPIKPRKTEAVS